MASSLRNTTEQQQPKYTEAIIRQTCASNIGQKFIYIVVEDVEDKLTYEKFMHNEDVQVMLSQDETGTKGYQNVEDIVTHLIQDGITSRICGIRDADYTRYEDTLHVFPNAVFITDKRDLEMTLLASHSVVKGLDEWKSGAISPILPIVYIQAKEIGYLRICNHVFNLGCNFKHKVKLSKVWDNKNHTLADGWISSLQQLFIQNCGNAQSPHAPYTLQKLITFITEKNLAAESEYNVCQGHDVVWLLYNLLTQNNFDIKKITDKMIESYSQTDFQTTQLYTNLQTWADGLGVKL